MRLLTASLLCLFLGCDSGALPGADAGVDSSIIDLAPSLPDMSSICHGLPEGECRRQSGCRADDCFACSCKPVYKGCHAIGDPPTQCPGLGCDQPVCCHAQGDCSQFLICDAPGQSLGCGACRSPGPACTSDADCAQGTAPPTICDVPPPELCYCNVGLQCIPGCASNSDCKVGEVCESDHHCRGMPCQSDADCPPNFSCPRTKPATVLRCERTPCKADVDCLQGYCVDNACYDALGVCTQGPI